MLSVLVSNHRLPFLDNKHGLDEKHQYIIVVASSCRRPCKKAFLTSSWCMFQPQDIAIWTVEALTTRLNVSLKSSP